MTEQEFYIWLLSPDYGIGKIPDFNPEFLKNYEIAKLFLEKFNTHLSRKEFEEINTEALRLRLLDSDFISLSSSYCDEKSNLVIPEVVKGTLDLRKSNIKKLKNVKKVNGNLLLLGSYIELLPNLEQVGGYIQLPAPRDIFPKLTKVGGHIVSGYSHLTWKEYFSKTNRQGLSEKVTVL